MISIKQNSVVLFQGDSVTDCHRDRNDITSMGESYVKGISEYLDKLFTSFPNDIKHTFGSFNIFPL